MMIDSRDNDHLAMKLLYGNFELDIDIPLIAWYVVTMTNKPLKVKQVAIRLTPDQWVRVNHYLIDHNTKFQPLILELLEAKIGLK